MNGNGHGKMILTRDQILAAVDLKIELVEVPEWGPNAAVYVRNLSGKGRDEFEGSRYKLNGEKIELLHDNTRAALLVRTLCDETGALNFTKHDIEALGQKNAAALDRCFEVAQR